MDIASAFIIYLTVFRLAIITAGVVSIILGYRLFCKGVWSGDGSGRGTTVDAKVLGFNLTLKSAAPGICFALFGVIIISVMLVAGSPRLTMEMLKSTGMIEISAKNLDTLATETQSWELRGGESDGLKSSTSKGIEFERQGDSTNAIVAYEEAMNIMATPMNQLAWLYQTQGKINEALPLSRLAVDLSPNNAAFLDTLAEILFKAGKHSEALSLMEKAANLNPKYRKKLARFGEIHK